MAEEVNDGLLCFKKGGSALAYSKRADTAGALIYKGGGWYIEVEFRPRSVTGENSGLSGRWIQEFGKDNTYTGKYWDLADENSTLEWFNKRGEEFEYVTGKKYKSGIIHNWSDGVISEFVFNVNTPWRGYQITGSFQDAIWWDAHGNEIPSSDVEPYNLFVTSYGWNVYVISYTSSGAKIQETLVVRDAENPASTGYWRGFADDGTSITLSGARVVITGDAKEGGKFTLSASL